MIKENINKLDNKLKDLFDSVKITESQEKSKFLINIDAQKSFEGKKVAVKVIIEKPQLESNVIKWRYLSNPTDSDSFLVERTSSLELLAEDINGVVTGKKLDHDYLDSLEEEQEQEEVVEEQDNREELVKLVENFGLKHLESHTVLEDHVYTTIAYFKHNLKNSDRQRVEMALEYAGWTKFIWNSDKLIVKFYE